MRLADKLLSGTSMLLWASLLAIPLLWPYARTIEGRMLPVVEDFTVLSSETVPEGVELRVRFNKVRDCEFRGLVWMLGEAALPVRFEIAARGNWPLSRVIGWQTAGPWTIGNVTALEGTVGVVIHRCHPLWLTQTHLYPPAGSTPAP